MTGEEMSMDKTKATVKDWLLLTRPWSAAAPLVPFLVGLGLAFGSRQIEPWGLVRWALGLTSGILLVYACNLFNTWGDERSGVDRMPGVFLTTPQIQQGKITLRQTFVFGSILFVVAGLVGLPTLFYSVSTPDAGGVRFVCDWLGLPETMRFLSIRLPPSAGNSAFSAAARGRPPGRLSSVFLPITTTLFVV